jgi:glycosyltransferase involved in cell wall biosynthesis
VQKKFLVITGIYPPDSGGPARFAIEFRDWLSLKKVEVQVITYSDCDVWNRSEIDSSVFKVSRNLPLPTRFLKFVHQVGKLLSRNQGVLVAGAFIETYLASLIYRFSYIAKVPGDIVWERARNNKSTNLDIEEYQSQSLSLKYRMFRILYSKSLKRAQIVVVPSLGLYNLCLKWGVSDSKLKLIYNSVETTTRATRPLTPKEFNLITVCRLVPWKGVDELITYAAKRKLRLLVVGNGPEKAQLETLAQSLNADVTFEGEVPHHQVVELLLKSDLFVLNSYYEGLPHALVEARGAGVLSIGRAGTGSAEVINDNQDGFLIRPDRSLEGTLDLAMEMLPKASLLIAQAKTDTFQRFSKEANFPRIFRLFLSEA